MATLLSDGIRAPLITDLQEKFKVQCTIDGSKGVLFKQEILPQAIYHNAFGLSSGFVPFRKTKISKYLASHPSKKPWESLNHTRPHSWNGSNSSKSSTADARDAIYFYSCKNTQNANEDVDNVDSLPGIQHVKSRPNTVQFSGILRQDSNGHRRSYTATQRFRTDQVRARKATMKKNNHNLNNGNVGFFAVRQVLPPQQKSLLAKKEQQGSSERPDMPVTLTRRNTKPKLPVRIDRPMKKEKGRYRPISRTAVKTPKQALEISTPRDHKDPQSAEAYKIILHEKQEQQRNRRKRYSSQSTPITNFRRANNMSSLYDDTENKLLQSVIEVNKPAPEAGDCTKTPPPSADGTKRELLSTETKPLENNN